MKTSTCLATVLILYAMVGALGCNTFRGAGKDIQRGGQAVVDAADDVQNRDGRRYTILASAESGGSIIPSGSITVARGAALTVTIEAYDGYDLADVLVDGESVGVVSRHTFGNVTANHTISASFALTPLR